MMQHQGILKNSMNHLSKRGPPSFFHSDTNLVVGNVLVHSGEKSSCSQVVTDKLIWLLFLNILSFNYVQTTNKSLRIRKFKRSFTYTSYTCCRSNKPLWNVDCFFYLMRTVESDHIPIFVVVCP